MLLGFVLTPLLFSTGNADDLVVLGNGHAPFYVSNNDEGRFDFSNDLKADYYVKAHYIGNTNQQLKIDYILQDECVDLGAKDASDIGGDTYQDAALKFALSNISSTPARTWLDENISISNPWFKSKKHDDNQMIDLALFPNGTGARPFPLDGNGDDAIQGLGKQGSFKHFDSLEELDGQSGWKGSVFLNAPPGDYLLWTVHPAGGIDECDRLSGFAIPIFIVE
ncbi:MAG: hypothetical protein K5777_06735 [Nitrosopumilus sp.]|nr:hypothetical protein [Nitrosopumilus sp.]